MRLGWAGVGANKLHAPSVFDGAIMEKKVPSIVTKTEIKLHFRVEQNMWCNCMYFKHAHSHSSITQKGINQGGE